MAQGCQEMKFCAGIFFRVLGTRWHMQRDRNLGTILNFDWFLIFNYA